MPKGFSIAELIIVMALISLILTIAVPAFMKMSGHARLTRASRNILTDLNAARLKAIAKNTNYRLAFTQNVSPAADTYRFKYWDSATSAWVNDTARAVVSVESGVDIESPGVDFNVDYYPNGTTTSATTIGICLSNTGDATDKMKVNVQGNTGVVTVQSGC